MKRRELIRIIREPEHIEPAAMWLREMVTKGLPGGPVQVSIGRERRSKDHNAAFHAICNDVSKQATYMGEKRSPEQWKVLFVSAHAMATGRPAEVVPGLEGEFVNIREATSKMTKARILSLMTYVDAWCAENGIELHIPDGGINP